MLTGCERTTDVDFRIDNQSNDTVKVEGMDQFLGQEIAINLLPGEERQISRMHFWGIREEHVEPTESLGSDLSIANAQGDTLVKDYRMSSHWMSAWVDHRWTATRTYVLTLEDGDFAQ